MPKNSEKIEMIKAKIIRAEKHLADISLINTKFKSVECSLSVEPDSKGDLSYLSFNLPATPKELPPIVGDCLNNLRSSLDYLIWQIVESNKISAPSISNMFPICETKQQFKKQLQKKRLRGVPEAAISRIEKLQPFSGVDNRSLSFLNALCNKDKHRDLNYTISVASDIKVSFFKNDRNVFNTMIGNDELRNGEVFGNLGFNPSLFNSVDVKIIGAAQAFIAFKDLNSEFGEVIPVIDSLNSISEHIKHEVIDSLVQYIS